MKELPKIARCFILHVGVNKKIIAPPFEHFYSQYMWNWGSK